jgi:O-antigen/teichoic acid export membrane protein
MSIRHAALWSMGSQYLTFVIQFAVSVIISRFFLTPAEVGLFSIALATTQLLAVLQEFGLTRYIAGQETLDKNVLKTCASVALIFAWGVAAFVALAAWPMASFYNDPRLFQLMLVLAASYLFVPFAVVPSAVLTRDMDFKSIFFINTGSMFITGAIGLGLAASGFSASALAWGVVAQAASRALIAQWRRPVPLPFPLHMKGALPVIKFGSAASILYISGAIGTRSPDMIVGRLITLHAVGLFSRATSLAGQLVILVAGAVGGVFYPAFARMRDRGEAFAPAYYRVVGCFTAIVWPAMAGLAVGAEPLVHAIYGEKWMEVAPLLRWIALSEIFFVMLPLHVELPILVGRIKSLIALNLFETTAAVTILAAACVYGVEMAALSRVLYGAVWFTIYARFVRAIADFKWSKMLSLYAQSGLATLAAVIPLGLFYTFWVPAEQMSFLQLTLGSGLGVLCWGGTMALTRHPALAEILSILAPVIARFRPTNPAEPGQASI